MQKSLYILAATLLTLLLFEKSASAKFTDCTQGSQSPPPCNLTINTVQNIQIILLNGYAQNTNPKDIRNSVLAQLAPSFDFWEISKGVLGPYWHQLTSQQQKKFVRLFSIYLAVSYVDQAKHIGKSTIKTSYELKDATHVVVQVILHGTKREYYFDNKFHYKNGEWKIYDVAYGDRQFRLSQVNSFRRQFARVLQNTPPEEIFKELEHVLKNKIKEIESPEQLIPFLPIPF